VRLLCRARRARGPARRARQPTPRRRRRNGGKAPPAAAAAAAAAGEQAGEQAPAAPATFEFAPAGGAGAERLTGLCTGGGPDEIAACEWRPAPEAPAHRVIF
jgi:hypothetical protein